MPYRLRPLLVAALLLVGAAWTVAPAVAEPPVCSFWESAHVTMAGNPIDFQDTSYDPDGDPIISQEWDFGDGSMDNGPAVTHTYPAAGIYTVCLRVCDDTGECSVCCETKTISAGGEPPVCLIFESTHNATVGTVIVFDGGASFDPDGGAIIAHQWDFGDGNADAGPLVSHSYAATGSYTVTLTVTDDQGDTSMCREIKNIYVILYPAPVIIEPIDPMWYEPLPEKIYPPPLPGTEWPNDNWVTLFATEANGRESAMKPPPTPVPPDWVPGDITQCRFEFSLDGVNWYLIGIDTLGTAQTLSGTPPPGYPPTSEPQYNQWSADWNLDEVQGIEPDFDEGLVTVRATMVDVNGYSGDSFFDVYCDLTPPMPTDLVPAFPAAGGEYEVYPEGAIIPLQCHVVDQNVEEVEWFWQPIPRRYKKGVPLMNQNTLGPTYCLVNDGAMWCVPTAHASSFKWWATAGGFPRLWPAARPDWVNRWWLARLMRTSCFDGTTIANQIRGARAWIALHGGCFVVAGPMRATPWRYIRELANCKEDVLLYWWWDDDPYSGGHEVTGNSFDTRPKWDLVVGWYWDIDYMDPCTGTYVWTKMTPGGRIEVPPGSGRWHQAWMKTISPRRAALPPFPPGEPWWPSCEVPGPFNPCDHVYTEWELSDPVHWSDPNTPVPAGLYLLKCRQIQEEVTGPHGAPVNYMMSDITIVEIADLPPSCGPIMADPPVIMCGETINFDSNAYDAGNPGGLGLQCDWEFGCGCIGSGCVTSHTYEIAGIFTVTCTVTDDEGSQATCTVDVEVLAPVPPPEPVLLDPIDPVWVDRRPPLTGQVALRCTEATDRTGTDGGGDIVEVRFDYGPTPNGPWTTIGTDTTSATETEGPDTTTYAYNWWSVPWDLDAFGLTFEEPLVVRATMTDNCGQTGEAMIAVWVDVTSMKPEIIEPDPNPEVIPEYPEGATIPLVGKTYDHNVVRVAWWWQPKLLWYVKGVPLLDQHDYGADECGVVQDGRMWCAPTAWASCLKWWADNGYPGLTAGLTDAQLVSGLAAAMDTDCDDGTTVADQIAGGRNWIAGHGGGLHVSGPSPVTPWDYRNELENCKEDVLLGIYWDTGGGHRVTGNSFRNGMYDDRTWGIDYMDPSTGTIVYTKMRAGGQIEFPPDSGRWHNTGNMITVSPDHPEGWWPSCEVEPPPTGPYHPADQPLKTEWDLNNPDEWQDPNTPMAGNRLYLLRCDMWDDTDHMMDETIVIRILDLPPTCAPTHAPEPALVGEPVHFYANAADAGNPGGIGLQCDWEFGCGCIGSGCDTSHTYMMVGVFEATCTVTDDEGSVAVCRDVVNVGPADCTVVCLGTVCGGPGPRKYTYEVTAPAGKMFDHWHMGIHDMDSTHYTNWVLPPGWAVLGFFDASLFEHNDFTPHGGISAPTGMCPHHIAFGGPQITSGMFAFDHPGKPHDVGWLVECVGADCPGPLSCSEDWTQPVGLGLGPIHSPIPAPPPVPVPLIPIDPAWVVDRPPISGLVPLYCKEASGRTGTDDPSDFGDIAQVTFEYSPTPNGMSAKQQQWILIGTDTTGATPSAGQADAVQYNWWSVDWDVGALEGPEGPCTVRVTMEDIYGQSAESFFDVYTDPTPPKPEIVHPGEYMTFDEGSVIDLICHPYDEDVIHVSWWWQPKQEIYVKGVPKLDQHDYGYTGGNCPKHPAGCPNDGDMWCVPTASASCLQWWAANGYPGLEPPDMTKAQFVEALGKLMKTDCEDGTTGPDQADGLREWIKNHGGGLHVTGPSPVTARDLRNELENCKEDVLFWLGEWDLWWHGVTLNSFRNRPIAPDIWEIDYMDPDDASIQWTRMTGGGLIVDRNGNWVNTLNLITVSPDVPTEPWWPSCEPPPPYPYCQDILIPWDLSDPDEWPDPNTPVEPGLKLLKCRMEDASGHVMTETIVIEILNLPPTCAITYTPANPQVGDTVNFNANASDPGGGTVTCSWTFGDGGGGGGCLISHVYTAAGTYNVTVTVSDAQGATATCTVTVVVAPATCQVVCTCSGIGPPFTYSYQVTAPAVPAGSTFDVFEVGTHDPVMANYTIAALPPGWALVGIACDMPWPLFRDNGYTPHGNISAPTGNCCYHMTFAGPPIANGIFKYTNPNPPHDVGWMVNSALGPSPPFPCQENWAMAVGMGQGPIHAPVYKDDLPPVCDPISWSPTSPWVGDVITFSCCACDPDGGAVTCTWDFGDGSPLVNGNPVNHSYAVAGCYTVKVTVTDNEGNTAACTADLDVPCMRVKCFGSACGGGGATQYRYDVTAPPPSVFTAFWVGTDDPYLAHYSNWDLPDGWTAEIHEVEPGYLFQHDEFHNHGVVSAPTGSCKYYIYFGTLDAPLNHGVFGFDHDGEPHDVAWESRPVPPGLPCTENWACPVGVGLGPVHSPAWQDLMPVCNITYVPAVAWVGQPVQFHANASDPDGGTVTCAWDFGDGGTSGNCDPVYTYLSANCYTVTVTVTDDEGNVVNCTATIDVACVRVICHGTACGGGGPTRYRYKVTAAPGNTFDSFELGTHDLVAANYVNWTMPAGWALIGIFCDEPWPLFKDNGYTVHGNISVPTGNCPGHILFAGPAINTGVFGYDNDNQPHDTGWLVSSAIGPPPCGENWACPVGTGLGPIHAPIYEPDQPPVCDPIDWSPFPDVWVGQPVTFSSCAYDPDGGPVTVSWAFGDGGTAVGNPVTYTYANPGCYTVTVTVKDDEGNVRTCSEGVNVYCVKVICDGAACGGSGPRRYYYEITAAPGERFDHVHIGTDDPNAANYTNWTMPAADWTFLGIADSMVRHDDFTPHGNISAPTGPCPYAMVFGGSPVSSGAIGFDHKGDPHDVGWQIECVGTTCPGPLLCVEDWACPVGMGLGPVHGPRCEVPLRVCKTDADGNPIAGWQFTIDSVDYITGDDGCVTVMVEPGTHEVCEQLPQTVAGKTYVEICGVTIDGAAVVPVENPVGSGYWCVTLTTGCEPNEAHVVIWCNRENLPPTCHITWQPDPGIVNEPVHFDANAADPDGDPVTCVWDFGCGCPPASGCQTSHTYGAPQIYHVTVTVTDIHGAVAVCTAPVSVIEPEPCKVICDGTACGGGGGGGAAPRRYYYKLVAPTGKVLDHFHIGVHDCDLNNYSNFVLPPGWSVTGIFTGMNPLDNGLTPHGNISAPIGQCPCALVFGGPPITSGAIGYDHAGPPHDVGWQLELTIAPTWICTEDWAMPVGLGQGPAHSPRPANQPPICSFTYVPLNPDDKTPVQFTDTSTDPDGNNIVAWSWDFGDGGTSNQQNPTHLFAAGTWNVCLTVTDDGTPPASSTCCRPITVVAAPCKVVCTDAGCTPTGVYSYWAAAPTGHMFDRFEVGTDDPNAGNYSNWVEPVGWTHGIAPIQGPHDGCTPHGNVSIPAGSCGWRVVWSGPPIPSGNFGFDHKGGPHDVGWLVELTGTWRCREDWLQPVGMGLGPVHGPKLFEDLPPVCDITYEWPGVPTPPPGTPIPVNTPVTFHANAYDPDGGPVTCSWDFGDGGIDNNCDAVHSYDAAGAYTVCVKVTDDEGTSTECCADIVVAPVLCVTLKTDCWHMITLPCQAINPDPWEVFDELRPPNQPWDLLSGNLHRYDHDNMKYVTYWKASPLEFGPIKPGDGYWLSLLPTGVETETICYEVECSGQPEALYFVSEGWYLMGSPQPGDTYIDDTQWYQGPLGPYPFSMIMDMWVMDPFIGYSCELGRYTYMGLKGTDEDDHLRMFQGYWMYAFEGDLTLVVPPPP